MMGAEARPAVLHFEDSGAVVPVVELQRHSCCLAMVDSH